MYLFKRILEFDPANHGFNITAINTKLNHLFVLATTVQRTLGEPELIQHTLMAHAHIKKPEEWVQWVRLQIDCFEEGLIPNVQSFMNTASLKYVKISENRYSSFGGSSTTISEDIVSMMAAVSNKRNPPPTSKKKIAISDEPNPKYAKTLRPFVRHFKSTAASDAAKFKVGSTKEWKGDIWYFFDYPNHHDRVKSRSHPAPECYTRQNWLEDKDVSAPVDAIVDYDGTFDSTDSSEITSLLASDMSLETGN